MSNLSTGIPMENRHISSSLMEKILSVKDNSLVAQFFAVYKIEATGKGIKNVTVNKAGEMTFCPKGKETIVDTTVFPNCWKKDGRQSGSFGKVLRKLLVETGTDPKSINASELESIVNNLKARYIVEGTFEIVSGSDIQFYYHYDNYADSNNGSMDSSCMRYGGACQEAAEFYAGNDNIEMVILKVADKKKSRGRALLWTDRDGKKWMDRIYANDHITAAFKQFAHSNDWPHKRNQDCCACSWVFPNGDERTVMVYVDVNDDYHPKPYMDTLCYVSGGVASNDDDVGGYCQSEPGDGDEGTYDEYADEYIDPDDAVYLEHNDFYTHYSNTFCCDIDGYNYLNEESVRLSNGDTVWRENEEIIYVEGEDSYYHQDDVMFCDYSDEYVDAEKIIYIEAFDIHVHQSVENNVYEDKGWVQDDDDNWVDPQEVMEY